MERVDLYAAAVLLTAVVVSSAASAEAVDPAAARGLSFLRANCSRCHALDKVSPSPLAIAPPFRNLHRRYPVESLEEAMAEGIMTGHPTMPEFRLDPGQIADVIANSRGGVMPAWDGRLDPVTVKALTYYVHSLGGGEK